MTRELKSLAEVRTVILCAGLSNRLKPVSDKSLLEFLGKPSLLHKLESLSVGGFSNFVLVAGKHNHSHIRQVMETTNYDFEIVIQENPKEGMAGAIKAVSDINNLSPILVVSNNDTVDQSLITNLAQAISSNPEESIIVGKTVTEYFPGGYLQHDSNLYLTNIIEKPTPGTEPSNMINLVYHYFSNPDLLFSAVHKTSSSQDDIYERSLLALVQAGQKFKVLPYKGNWIPIKNPLHITETANYFIEKNKHKGIHPKAEIHPTATIKGAVIIEEGAKIDANAVIYGPTYIGANSIVGVNSFIRSSHIGANSVIGFSSEVARSYIGNHTWLHNNYIGDSIVGSNVAFGAGCITGNLKLDETEVAFNSNKLGIITGNDIRVGIATHFMPGTKIGSNTIISASLTIGEDIPNNSFVKANTPLTATQSPNIIVKENLKTVKPRSDKNNHK